MKSRKKPTEFTPEEVRSRFEAALRGARIAGHRSKEEVSRTLGKVEAKPTKEKKPAK